MRHLLLLATLFVAQLAVAQDAETLLKTCVECHGTNGIAKKPGIPHLDRQDASYMYNTLRNMSDGRRKTAVAEHKNIASETRKAMTSHYAAQKVTREKSPTDAALVKRGDELYLSRCAECHPDNGRDRDKEAPVMAAQDLDYLIKEALAFKKGERPFATMMDDAYKGLSEADLTAVAHFFASQDQVAPKSDSKRKRR